MQKITYMKRDIQILHNLTLLLIDQ